MPLVAIRRRIRPIEAQIELSPRTRLLDIGCGGGAVLEAPKEAGVKTAAIAKAGLPLVGRKLAWPALLRRLDRVDPSYRD